MADLTPGRQEIDARSQALIVRRLEIRRAELALAGMRCDLEIQELHDKIARRSEALAETRAALEQVEAEIQTIKEKVNG